MNDHFYPNGNRFRRNESQPENYTRNFKGYQMNDDHKSFGDDCGNRYTWHDKVNRIQKELMEEKTNCEKIQEQCVQKRITISKMRAMASHLNCSQNIQQLQNKLSQIDLRIASTSSDSLTAEQKLKKEIKTYEIKIAEMEMDKNKLIKIDELQQTIYFKQSQLYQLCDEQKKIQRESSCEETLKKQILQIEQACNNLKARKKKAKENIKELKSRRFDINQNFSKQQRINSDLAKNIQDVNDKIEKQAQIDEKLRIENLKKMQESEANKLHPADLPFEDLRKLKQKNHQLKLIIHKVKEAYEAEIEEDIGTIPPQIFQQMQSKIEKSTIYVNKYSNITKQNLDLKDNIRKLKSQKDQFQCIDHSSLEIIKKQIQKLEESQIQLKATNKIYKRQAQSIAIKLKKYQKKLSQIQSEENRILQNDEEGSEKSSKPTHTTMKNKQNEDNLCRNQVDQFSSKNSQSHKNKKKSIRNDKYSQNEGNKGYLKNNIPVLQENNLNYDTVYIKRPFKKGQMAFTIFYLFILFVLGYYYNKIRVWFIINN